ncbi:MAG: hypothetical protein ACFFEF_06170 [Candidatus Thorarchaeota archaeon]
MRIDINQDHEYFRQPKLNRIRVIVKDFTDALRIGVPTSSLITMHAELMFALDSLWLNAIEGSIHVKSIALLRALRRVICPDVGDLLMQPVRDNRRIERDVFLIVNTIEQLI